MGKAIWVLAAVLAGGCAPTIRGEWTLDQVDGGDGPVAPKEYLEADSVEFSMDFGALSGGTGEVTGSAKMVSPDGTYTYSYAGDYVPGEESGFFSADIEVTAADLDGESFLDAIESGLDWSCERVDASSLHCADADATWIFVR